jgi:hypothetical protein
MSKSDHVDEFLASYPQQVAELARGLRAVIARELPGATEALDRPGRIVAYSVGPGYKGSVCTIIPSKTGVKLGIVEGAALDDPRSLLEGEGKRHRYVAFSSAADVGRPGVKSLLVAARKAADARLAAITR